LKSIVNRPERQLLSVYLERGVVRFSDVIQKRTNATSEDLSKYQAVDEGDFVLNNQQAWRGSVGVSNFSGIVSPAYLVLALSKRYLPRYANLLLRDQSMVSQYLVCSKGVGSIQRNLYWPHLKRVGVVIPPPDEQTAIVRFLDWANGRLEKAIRAKQKVIKLLNEQKQTIIHQALTRGLDPSVALKPTGIPWLKEAPEHWGITPLKRIAWFKSGAGFPVEEQGKSGLGIPFLKVSDMTKAGNELWIESENNTVTQQTAERLGAFLFPAQSIIFPKVGGAMLTNKRRLLRNRSCIDNNLMGCVVKRGDLGYIFSLLEYLDFGLLSKPGPVPAISEGEVREINVPLPPLDEQKALARFIRKETQGILAAKCHLEKEIELLREYRTRLVADVVTGKLDVRDVALRLSAEEPLTAESMDADPDDYTDVLVVDEESDA
jgi:type I restriction enzyme S subunit